MPEYESINLHPSSHSLSTLQTDTYDVICLGSGWAGRVVGARIVKAGLTALIVESELVGGDCPYWACVPSKALLRPLEVLDSALAVGGVKELLPAGAKLDVDGVFKRRNMYTAGFDDSVVLIPMVEGSGAALVRGYGKIVGDKAVQITAVDGKTATLKARHAVVVATGSVPFMPAIPGLADAKPWTARHATSSDKAPKRLIVLGAGAVGTEMATAYASFGSTVTLITYTTDILPSFDDEVGKLVRESMVSQGIKILVSTRVAKVVHNAAQGVKEVHLASGDILQAEEILVASGRRATTSGLGLEQFGIPVDGSPVEVDEAMRATAVPGGWLYAGGDINGRAPTTHSSKYHGRVISNAILAQVRGQTPDEAAWGSTSATADLFAFPQVVFTRPPVASVGMTVKKAEKIGAAVRVIHAPVISVGSRIHAENIDKGWAQWVVEEHSGRLLGATFVGKGVEELVHASTVAIVGHMTLDRLAHAIPPFPTISEVYLNLLDAAGL